MLWARWSCFSPLTGHVSSEALCCPLLVNAPLPSGRRRAGMDIWQLSITAFNRCGSDSSSPHSAPFPLSVFPPSIKTDKVKLGLISPVADNRSLARPTEKLYCSIVIDGNHRWALITAAGTWCSICFMLFHSFHKAKWAFCVMCSYFTVIRRVCFFFATLFFFSCSLIATKLGMTYLGCNSPIT